MLHSRSSKIGLFQLIWYEYEVLIAVVRFSLKVFSWSFIKVDILSQIVNVFNSQVVSLSKVFCCSMNCFLEYLQNASLCVMLSEVVAVCICEHANDIWGDNKCDISLCTLQLIFGLWSDLLLDPFLYTFWSLIWYWGVELHSNKVDCRIQFAFLVDNSISIKAGSCAFSHHILGQSGTKISVEPTLANCLKEVLDWTLHDVWILIHNVAWEFLNHQGAGIFEHLFLFGDVCWDLSCEFFECRGVESLVSDVRQHPWLKVLEVSDVIACHLVLQLHEHVRGLLNFLNGFQVRVPEFFKHDVVLISKKLSVFWIVERVEWTSGIFICSDDLIINISSDIWVVAICSYSLSSIDSLDPVIKCHLSGILFADH